MGKKKDNDIIVTSLGSSTLKVTGSCWKVQFKKDNGEDCTIVLECGLDQQENDFGKLYNSNKRMLDGIGKETVASTDYLLLGHSHVDHIGNLSYFNDDNGFKGRILGGKKTIEIGKQLIKDSVYIHTKNLEQHASSKGKKLKPLYTEVQMYQMFNHMEQTVVGEKIKLNDNLTIQFHNNNHSVGSTSISLWIRKCGSNTIKHILYSSDLGTSITQDMQPYIAKDELPRKCNLFISEATYNTLDRQFAKKDALAEREEFKKMLKDSVLQGKRVLLATFSYNRCQLLLTQIYEWFKDEEWFRDIPVVCDGMLSNKINDIYLNVLEDDDKELFTKVMQWKNLKLNREYSSTLACLSKRTPGIYLAGSGFLQNGRVSTYLPIFLGCSKDIVVLTGYCGGEGSIGYKVLNPEQKTVTIDKKVVLKRAEVKQLRTYTSHITFQELLNLWTEMRCDKIIIHHSDCGDDMIDYAREYMRDRCITTPIVKTGKGCYEFKL